jgi:hypothetical protein
MRIGIDRQLSSRPRPRNAKSKIKNARRLEAVSKNRGKYMRPLKLVDQMRDSAVARFGDGYRGE